MKKNYFTLLITLVFSLNAYTQNDFIRTPLGDVYYDANQYKAKYNNPEGSPYLKDNFTSAQINDMKDTQFVRFNAYEGKVEAKVSSNQVVELDASESYVIMLKDGSGKVYETRSYVDSKGEVKYSFFERIQVADDYTLYLKEQIKYNKAVKAEAYKEAQPAGFKKAADTFFINDLWRGSEDLVQVPEKAKNFTALFPNQAKSLKSYIKQEKIKLNERDDLIRILDHCFALQ